MISSSSNFTMSLFIDVKFLENLNILSTSTQQSYHKIEFVIKLANPNVMILQRREWYLWFTSNEGEILLK